MRLSTQLVPKPVPPLQPDELVGDQTHESGSNYATSVRQLGQSPRVQIDIVNGLVQRGDILESSWIEVALQIGETFRPSQSAILPPRCVTWKPVIPSTLYIQRDKIQAAWDGRVRDWVLEEVIGQLRGDVSGRHLDHVSGRGCDGTLQPALRVQAVRVEQHSAQLHVGGGARPLVGHPHQPGQQGVGESERGRGKTVRYTRVDARVVPVQFPPPVARRQGS